MSTIVCQNLLSSHLTETTTTLKLKVPPPTDDRDYLNFALKTGDNKINYSKLSPKSLELCTENLGSETGTDIISDGGGIFPPPPPFSNSGDFPAAGRNENWERRPRHNYHHTCRKINNFPPPLTSSNSLQVRHHREGGRLIIEAVEAPFRNSYLTAERSGGRLKLCFLTTADAAERIASAEEEEEETVADVGPASINDEINLEKEKLKRLSRCKEGSHGGKGLGSNWKPALWVATS